MGWLFIAQIEQDNCCPSKQYSRFAIILLHFAGCAQQHSKSDGPLSEGSTLPDKTNMILQLYPPPNHEPTTITDAPDAGQVEATIRNQPWDDITFVVLRIDDANWFEVSGSLDPSDGLSAAYSEDGIEHVSDGAPESLDICVSLMLSYLRSDDKWRTAIDWH